MDFEFTKKSFMLVISNHSAFRGFGSLKYHYCIIKHKQIQLPISNNINLFINTILTEKMIDLFSSKYYSSDIYNVLVSSIDEISSAKTFFNIFAVGIVIKEKNTKCVWKNW